MRLTAGNYDKLRAEGAVSGPLVKNKVMGGFAFLRGSRDGFVKDLDHPDHSLGSEDTWAGRGQLRVVLGTHGELLLSGDYGRFDGVPLTLCEADRGEAGVHLRQPRQPVGGAHEPSGVREEHPAGRLGEAGCPIERHDDGDQPDRVSKVRHAFLRRPRRDRTADRDDRGARTSSARSRRS